MKVDDCLHTALVCLGMLCCSFTMEIEKMNHLRSSLHGHHEKGKEGQVLHRSKRGWVWNQFFVIEEYTGPDPVLVGRLHSDIDSGDGNIKYILSGEGAGIIFVIDDKSGNIHATKTLDREERAQYTLTAQAVDRNTNRPLEPPSEFIVKVQDINDNPPEFLHENYHANVPERSNVGTSVIQVTASDADDPTYGNSAKLVYSILEGQPYFSVEAQTGIIRTALPNMDREAKEEYHVVIQAKDMGGHMGGLSGTTKVTITLTDVNDNPPKFPQSVYQMSISEASIPGEEAGRVKAKDPDIGENGLVTYNIIDGDGIEMFEITTDYETQEGVVKLKKHLDYETKRTYSLKVEAANIHIDPKFISNGPFKDTVTVKINVEDADEPPIFLAPFYILEVEENAGPGAPVGRVHAKDPDAKNSLISYLIDRHTDLDRYFSISPEDGSIMTTKNLDREEMAWHNISVFAYELHNRHQEAKVPVVIKVLDVNDNAPKFKEPYEAAVCEKPQTNELLITIKAEDKDAAANGPRFIFGLPPEMIQKPNFTLQDNKDNTASVYTKRTSFNRQTQDLYFLPIVISDGGSPPQSSTNMLTIRVCGCNGEGKVTSCNPEAYILNAGLSTGALIAILACIVILLVIVVLFVTLKRQKKEPLIVFEEEDVRENIITYDDEGGGEEDTEAFDIATLQNPDGINGFIPRKDIKPEYQYMPRPGLRPAPNSVDVDDFINTRIQEADNDPTAPPYDSIQIYGYEGRGSVAGSLSSLESATTDSDLDYDYLQNWGPRFKKLADLYGSKDTFEDDS
ncbi:cadherin-11 [Rhineura floridana]|uniref:cadherin-11 n=1 Tax=Rhineura floridana TaxID=261503 RepID=UPI002AC8043C|nr:cadherin-11 [Rhineura floridana]XP_061449696.1 cadherin-11 [Rhineura floridana]XP_061449698.1 cadherin-11 [Rhineura floridana]XP_061449699.1 cadherin-11 [Rhineura floridana]XP_061449700.1 cadherin-11 [Rhineura floridana]XP_061449701.1 cadherin-11 [Rhineura floridana]XP_061449702.1 cadherin-11 [Rhineura floridana]